MALFAIGDTHLSLGTDQPITVFAGWDNYVERLEENWRRLVSEDDTVVIAGDISWGMSLEQAKPDFAFLHSLPGRKLLFKGNHDYWWTTRRKMDTFFEENGFTSLRIVHNDAVAVDGCMAVCGSRGWFNEDGEEADHTVLLREAGRLRASITAAKQTGLEPVVFLHYPPTNILENDSEFTKIAEEYGAEQVIYAHSHGEARFHDSIQGEYHGIRYSLVSGDFLRWKPQRIL